MSNASLWYDYLDELAEDRGPLRIELEDVLQPSGDDLTLSEGLTRQAEVYRGRV